MRTQPQISQRATDGAVVTLTDDRGEAVVALIWDGCDPMIAATVITDQFGASSVIVADHILGADNERSTAAWALCRVAAAKPGIYVLRA